MGYQTKSVYGRVPVVNLRVSIIRRTDHEHGLDHISALCHEPFGVTVSPARSVEAQYMPGEHEGEGFYVLDIEVPVGTVIHTFRI